MIVFEKISRSCRSSPQESSRGNGPCLRLGSGRQALSLTKQVVPEQCNMLPHESIRRLAHNPGLK